MMVDSKQRFTRRSPCPVCGSHSAAPKSTGERCWGFLSDDGNFAHCTRGDIAGNLPLNERSQTYPHRLNGSCPCGQVHRLAGQGASFGASQDTFRTRKIVATYDYVDEQGVLLFQSVRYVPKDFSQRRPDGSGGWLWNLDGVRRVLYGLPELLGADPEQPVFIPEGEKDRNRLVFLGLVATCNPMGAKKWSPEYNGPLADRHVVILPDKDKDGEQHGVMVGTGSGSGRGNGQGQAWWVSSKLPASLPSPPGCAGIHSAACSVRSCSSSTV